jgi:pyruvate dehydrogenase E2 component (dihydrolipoamide acetyltransferase)
LASQDIVVPDLGEFKDVAVIEVLVRPGDAIQVDTPLVTLETEKATMDVPAPQAGVIARLHVEKGSRVSAGSLIATLEPGPAAAPMPTGAPPPPASSSSGAAAAAPATAAAAAPRPGAAPESAPDETLRMPAALPPPVSTEPAEAELAHASPSVRRFARELGADLARIAGSGQKGRITEQDVKSYVKSVLAGGTVAAAAGAAGQRAGPAWPAVPAPDFAQYGPIEFKPLGRVQRISGPRLQASWVNLPHVTQFDEADVTRLEEVRKGLRAGSEGAGVRLTTLSFILRACSHALLEMPLFNSSLDASGENIVYKKYIHIGIATDTPQGLLVPVIRDVNRKDIYEIARAVTDLSQKARRGKLAAGEMQGGSFTVSSLGSLGGTGFTPIINAPEVAILGVARAALKPVHEAGSFVPRLMLPLSLSYDHRVIDGVSGARFMSFLVAALSDVHGLLEAVP